MKWLGPVVVVLIAVLAELTVGRAAHGPDAALFFGRFHPLIVHLPIGFFLLVAAGEAATFHPKLRDRVEPVLGLLIPISAAAALGAFLMGQLLALEGGFPAQALQWHRRLTLFAVMGMAACWVAFDRQHQKGGQGRWLYRGIMGATLGLLSLGAHFGGTMTRGEAYLSKYAPGPLKPLLGAAEPKKPAAEPAKAVPAGAEPLVFKDVVLPILTEHCVECHGTEKQKGKLRLDSLEELMKGGENGDAVVAGLAAKSPLLQRMLLPVSDDDRMPPEGKPSPKPEALALIEFWIERGASPTLKVKDALAPAASRSLLEHAAGGAAKAATVPGAAAAPAPSDSAAPSPVEATATAPAEKAEPGAAPDSESAKKSAVSEPAAKPEPASAPEPAAPTQPASASGPVLSGTAFLSTYCSKCHGASKQKGKLRVDSLAAMLKGGAEGPALVPGSPDKSSLVTRLRLPLSNDEHMPPAKETQPSSAEVAAFASWVRSGAGGGATAASKPAQPATVTASTTSNTDTTTAAIAEPSSTGSTTASEPVAAAPPPADEKPSGAAEPAPVATGPADPALLQSLPPRVTLFSDAVAPLLREKCGKCHIKDKPAGGLDVAKHAALLEGGYSGAGVVPKDRKQSVLFARIILPTTDDERMPPEGEPALSADEVELLGAWIDQGAPAGGPTEVAALPGGAVRALSALGVKAGPEPLASQSGGCAACSVPGAPLSTRLALQSVSLLAGIALVFAARRRRRGR